ncbi:MAG: ypdA 16 [Bacillota bacterium]|jgi:two-component system sensor histidine kinase YesM|nr:ypdA 16 [Bacillota bacterium]
MGMARTIKIYMMFLFLLVLFLLLGYITKLLSPIWMGIFLVNLTILTLWLYLTIARPLSSFEDSLDRSIETEMGSEALLDNLSDDILFKNKIKDLVEKCANEMIRENSAEMLDKQAELAALQSQINPHFLYNTLETIRGYALIDDNNDIAKIVEALAAFFRYSINRRADLVTLRDELVNIQNYMMILKFRFNNRFTLEIIIDDDDSKAYDYFIPKLILQPIVENAIFHGLEDCVEGGRVTIEVIETEKNLLITVSDNGKGMDGKALNDLNERIRSAERNLEAYKSGAHRNTGIALSNIQKRIQLLFGPDYGLSVYSTVNQGTDVELTIPAGYERRMQKGTVSDHEKGNATHQ